MFDQFSLQRIYALLTGVAQFQLRHRRNLDAIRIQEKSLNQLVSYVDVQSEQMLVEGLSKITPDAGFIAEEGTSEEKPGNQSWIIDPLDGTTNFLFGHEQFTISIAFRQDEQIRYGGIFLPVSGDYYYSNGDGAFLNDRQIRCSVRNKLSETLIATGFPYYEFKEMPEYLLVLNELMSSTRGLRRMGSAALDLALTAQGRFDGFFELNLSPWDVAAGSFLVSQAGGRVCDFSGADNFLFGRSIIAGNPQINKELLQLMKKHFNLRENGDDKQ
jgi:myo-inositol-1(or 4)-monophosphatase